MLLRMVVLLTLKLRWWCPTSSHDGQFLLYVVSNKYIMRFVCVLISIKDSIFRPRKGEKEGSATVKTYWQLLGSSSNHDDQFCVYVVSNKDIMQFASVLISIKGLSFGWEKESFATVKTYWQLLGSSALGAGIELGTFFEINQRYPLCQQLWLSGRTQLIHLNHTQVGAHWACCTRLRHTITTKPKNNTLAPQYSW